MLLCVAGVVDAEGVARLRRLLEAVRFVDGRATAGWHARLVKSNRQADAGDPSVAGLRGEVERLVLAHPLVAMAARPKAVSSLLFSRYDEGMGYGRHVDDALMGGQRADISFTLFLAEPDAYDGGELVIEGTGGEEAYKLAAGSLLLYPSTSLHRVEPVRRGSRLAAVGWIRSHVRDAHAREILFDLDTARRRLFERDGGRGSEELDLLNRSVANLTRLWAED